MEQQINVLCLEEEIVFSQFKMTTLQLLKESPPPPPKKRVKVASKTAMIYFQSYDNLF